jgi:hypothetical protein
MRRRYRRACPRITNAACNQSHRIDHGIWDASIGKALCGSFDEVHVKPYDRFCDLERINMIAVAADDGDSIEVISDLSIEEIGGKGDVDCFFLSGARMPVTLEEV